MVIYSKDILMNSNPLASAQREKSGAITFGKYEFQYHWALCRIIDEQLKTREYAVFVELHEDVVVANSLNSKVATFEFNQVKNIASPKYNINNLTKTNGSKKSVLGKLINSALNKPFSSKVSTINLVASCGFNIDLIDNNLNLEIITIGDLSKKSVSDLQKAIITELGIGSFPDNLRFIVPQLSIVSQQDTLIGKIASLVSSIFPGSHCNAENIYRILIDDLHRKGEVHYDYTKWDDLLEKKALTSTQVKKTISTQVSLQDIQSIINDVNEIAKELKLNYIEKKSLRQSIERIHIKTIGFPTSLSIKVRKNIYSSLLKVSNIESKDIDTIIREVETAIPNTLKSDLGSTDNVRNNIIYQIIMGDI